MRKITAVFIIFLLAFGCTPTEKLKYAIDSEGSKNQYYNNRLEKTIQPYDYLYIRIYSLDQKTASVFNGEMQFGATNESLQSYEVNNKGYISFPFVGDILVKDLTIEEAQVKLENELNKYLTNISLRVRFVGNKITIIGEVYRPGNYTFYDEKITVFQALGLAGDIASYGDKTKVTLLRENDNVISYHYMNLTDKKIVESDFYYLLPNDILIVDPVPFKYRTMQDRSLVYLILSALTTLATTASITITLLK